MNPYESPQNTDSPPPRNAKERDVSGRVVLAIYLAAMGLFLVVSIFNAFFKL